MSAANFDPQIFPEGWFSSGSSVSIASWFDASLTDNTVVTAVANLIAASATVSAATQVIPQAIANLTAGSASLSSTANAAASASASIQAASASISAASQVGVASTLSTMLADASMTSAVVVDVQVVASLASGNASVSSATAVSVRAALSATTDTATTSSTTAVAVVAQASLTASNATLLSEVIGSLTTPHFVDASIVAAPAICSSTSAVSVFASASIVAESAHSTSVINHHRIGFGGSSGRTTVVLKQADGQPPLSVVIVDLIGRPVDLSFATSVDFRMALTLDRVERFSRPALVDDVIGGAVSYVWQPGDMSLPGVFYGEFAVTWVDGSVQTYPQTGYLVVVVEPKV